MDEVRNATAELRVTEESGIKLLVGDAKVQLVVTAVDVATPQEAVDVVIRDLFRRGLDAFTFLVTDMESGSHFLVQQGVLLSTKEARASLGEDESDDSDAPTAT